MKIIHIGSNFLNAKESEKEFTVYSKPDSTLLKDGKPFFIPDFAKNISYELNVVYRINRLGKNISQRFAHRYYDAVTMGLSLTDTEMFTKLISEKSPLELATGFDGSSILGTFVSKEELDLSNFNVRLEVDSHTTQRLSISDIKTSIDEIIARLSQFYTFKIGDLIFIGDSVDAVGTLQIGQQFKGFMGNEEIFNLKIC